MAPKFIIILLTTMAILPEIKSNHWGTCLAEPEAFPFIAIINIPEESFSIGALVTANKVLGPEAAFPPQATDMTVDLGCIEVESCAARHIPVSHYLRNHSFRTMIYVLGTPVVLTSAIFPIPIRPSESDDELWCKFLGFDIHNYQELYWINTKIMDRASCLVMRGRIPRNHACFFDVNENTVYESENIGGPMICDRFLFGLMSVYPAVDTAEPVQLVSNLTGFRLPNEETGGFQPMPRSH
ncbi:uncharacterized protein [Fopius arisanus]|uniref:Uncharacterized protein n=1 Tax=Fopius arisanus TaxID=64838 RepID=A0A9R1T8Z3_9HYME|nr:PREDICTED: uncharacterized protein LOC105267611 [Fopius arisanus]